MKQLLTLPEVAQILNVSEDTVYTMARRKEIPVVRISRLIRVDPEALEQWMNDGGKGGWKREA